MSTQNNLYANVSHVVEVSSQIGKPCEHCNQLIGLDKFAEAINHYIDQHGYKLLYVGGQTTDDYNGNPAHGTVAILGK